MAKRPSQTATRSANGTSDKYQRILDAAIEVIAEPDAAIIAMVPGLDDAFFEHDGQLTKREIRAVTLSSLEPRHGELLWDVGLGAGSIAIEWLLRHPSLRAIGVEEREDRAGRAARNAAALGEFVETHPSRPLDDAGSGSTQAVRTDSDHLKRWDLQSSSFLLVDFRRACIEIDFHQGDDDEWST